MPRVPSKSEGASGYFALTCAQIYGARFVRGVRVPALLVVKTRLLAWSQYMQTTCSTCKQFDIPPKRGLQAIGSKPVRPDALITIAKRVFFKTHLEIPFDQLSVRTCTRSIGATGQVQALHVGERRGCRIHEVTHDCLNVFRCNGDPTFLRLFCRVPRLSALDKRQPTCQVYQVARLAVSDLLPAAKGSLICGIRNLLHRQRCSRWDGAC